MDELFSEFVGGNDVLDPGGGFTWARASSSKEPPQGSDTDGAQPGSGRGSLCSGTLDRVKPSEGVFGSWERTLFPSPEGKVVWLSLCKVSPTKGAGGGESRKTASSVEVAMEATVMQAYAYVEPSMTSVGEPASGGGSESVCVRHERVFGCKGFSGSLPPVGGRFAPPEPVGKAPEGVVCTATTSYLSGL